MDTHGYLHENNTHNCDFVKRKMIENELNDIWRERNPFWNQLYLYEKKKLTTQLKHNLTFS